MLVLTVGYKTQDDIQAMEEKISSPRKEKEEAEQTNDQLLTYSSKLRARAERVEKDLAKSNTKFAALDATKLQAEANKLNTEKVIDELKAKVATVEDS